MREHDDFALCITMDSMPAEGYMSDTFIPFKMPLLFGSLYGKIGLLADGNVHIQIFCRVWRGLVTTAVANAHSLNLACVLIIRLLGGDRAHLGPTTQGHKRASTSFSRPRACIDRGTTVCKCRLISDMS